MLRFKYRQRIIQAKEGRTIKATKKGQAAVEYLMTYGWMILVIIVTIGLIIYFDVLSPIKFVPQQCEFGEQLKCEDMLLLSNGTFKIKFLNNFPKDINITDAASQEYSNPEYNINCGGDITIPSNAIGTLSCNIIPGMGSDLGFAKGDKKQIRLKITFQRKSSADPLPPKHELRGVFVTNVESLP